MILSLLVGAGALPAANPVRPRMPVQNRTSAQLAAKPGDPCDVSRMTPGKTPAAPSGSALSLVKLMNRVKGQGGASEAPGAIRRAGDPLHPGVDPGDSLPQELWTSRVEAPQTGKEAESSLALKRLIRQVRSVTFDEQNPEPAFTPPAEPQPGFQMPVTPIAQAEGPGSAAPAVAAPAASESAPSLSAKDRKTLETLQQNPGQVQDPLEMAELLFLSGRPTEAAPFYAKALDRISRLDPSYDADRAWILFQLGNCLRETDTAGAQEVYMKLVAEYPASPWTELAKAHGRLLTWYQKSRPEQLGTAPQL